MTPAISPKSTSRNVESSMLMRLCAPLLAAEQHFHYRGRKVLVITVCKDRILLTLLTGTASQERDRRSQNTTVPSGSFPRFIALTWGSLAPGLRVPCASSTLPFAMNSRKNSSKSRIFLMRLVLRWLVVSRTAAIIIPLLGYDELLE